MKVIGDTISLKSKLGIQVRERYSNEYFFFRFNTGG